MNSKSLKSANVITKRLTGKLLEVCPAEKLIDCLVTIFVKDNRINPKNDIVLNCIHTTKRQDEQMVRKKLNAKCTFDMIKNAMDYIVDHEDRQRFGVVYTPNIIVNYIVNETIKKNTKYVCDPACGNSAFLLSVVKKMHETSGKLVSTIIEKNIYGMDILPIHIKHSKILLALYMLMIGEDKKTIKFNFKTCNSLTVDWRKIFPKVINGFDVIIGNPPYVRIQDISEHEKQQLTTKWKTCVGSYNLYFTFFEVGINMLNKNGTLGYICANSFFTSFAAKKLRSWFQENRYVRKIIDFTHLVIFNATSYTCVIFLDKKHNTGIKYNSITKYSDLDHLNKLDFNINRYEDLNYNKWRLLKTNEREIINKIETTGKPLGQITEIRSGIATLKDKIYFVPYSKNKYLRKIHDGKEYHIEKNITKNMIKIPDVDTVNIVPTHKIIFPYKKINGKYTLIPELELKKKYPKCYKYLHAMKDILSQRDGGKQDYEAWYSYGRKQGFDVDDEKLLTPTFSVEPRFLFDTHGNSFFCNGYAIHNSDISLDVVQKILNSMIMDYYITRTSVFVEGGYCCFQKNFIERFGIPNLSESEIEYMKKINNSKQIDKFLSKKYGINLLAH